MNTVGLRRTQRGCDDGVGRKPRVVVLFGGRSSEHRISCLTAKSVVEALDREKYDPLLVGVTQQGTWTLMDLEQLNHLDTSVPQAEESAGFIVVRQRKILHVLPGREPESLGEADVIFPLFHGPYGEDGTVQGLLELENLPYVGSGVLASAVGMDKEFMKVVLSAAGFDQAPYQVIRDSSWRAQPDAVLERLERLGWPMVVKPARGGSSLGIGRAEHRQELRATIERARQYDLKVVVEAAVVGREIECAVLQGRHGAGPRTTVPGEIVAPQGGFLYDFDAKYIDAGAVVLQYPAELSDDIVAAVRHKAAEAFLAIDAEGLARVDFFYTTEGQLLINEINTMPGFTPRSMFPLLWQTSGVDYAQLIEELLTLALERPTGLR